MTGTIRLRQHRTILTQAGTMAGGRRSYQWLEGRVTDPCPAWVAGLVMRVAGCVATYVDFLFATAATQLCTGRAADISDDSLWAVCLPRSPFSPDSSRPRPSHAGAADRPGPRPADRGGATSRMEAISGAGRLPARRRVRAAARAAERRPRSSRPDRAGGRKGGKCRSSGRP